MHDQLISKISKSIGQNHAAIFCGAGISYHSGLPLANDLMKKILELIDLNEADSSLILNSNLPFESFIETIKNEVSVDEILEIFRKGEPNTNHELIAELVNSGIIKTILTCNFDLLIEKALINKGLQKTDFEVYASEEEFGKINWNDNKIKIIKIHGCASNKSEMAITMSLVASKTACVNKNRVINDFFSKNINSEVIVIGYSCSDLFDISPQIENINEKTSEIFFVEHENNSSDYCFEDIALRQDKNPFKSFSGKRIKVHTDVFIKEIWKLLVKKEYRFISNSTLWVENLDKWLIQSIESNSIGIKSHISARLFFDIGAYEHAVKDYEKGIFIAQKEGNQIVFYSELGNLGVALNAIGKYKEAQICLEESINACHYNGNIQGEIAQLKALGNIYRNIGKFNEAITLFKRAILLAEREEFPGLCTSLGDLATVYNHTEQPDEAIKYINWGLKLAYKIGNKQAEGSMLITLGIAYFQKGEKNNAIQSLQKSINILKMIGDKRGECTAILNLSNFDLFLEDFDESIKKATLALQIAQKIGVRQSEAGAYFNIGSASFLKGDSISAVSNLKKALNIFEEIYGDNHPRTRVTIGKIFQAENMSSL